MSLKSHALTAAAAVAVWIAGEVVIQRLLKGKSKEDKTSDRVLADVDVIKVQLPSADILGCNELELPASFLEMFTIGDCLGSGSFGSVFAVEPKLPQHLAVKLINKSKLAPNEMSHPNILKLYDVLESPTHVLILTERAMGGDLYTDLVAKVHYDEDRAKEVLKQLVSAVMYLHKRGIIHRDLKPENVLLEEDSSNTAIKICDFGLAKWFPASATGAIPSGSSASSAIAAATPVILPSLPTAKLFRTSTIVGSHLYAAPEVCGDAYSFPVDYFSIGIILHFMLVGWIPDKGEAPDFTLEDWKDISQPARDVVAGLLEVDPTKRMSGIQVLYSPWLQCAALPPDSPVGRPSLMRQGSSTMSLDAFSKLRIGGGGGK